MSVSGREASIGFHKATTPSCLLRTLRANADYNTTLNISFAAMWGRQHYLNYIGPIEAVNAVDTKDSFLVGHQPIPREPSESSGVASQQGP